MTVFEALTWDARDDEDIGRHVISIFGRTADGKSVCVSTVFEPYFFIKLSKSDRERSIFERIGGSSYQVVQGKDLWGFQNNEVSEFLKLNFPTLAAMKAADYKTRRENLRVYESNLEPLLRFMHRTGIQSTGWLDTGDQCMPAARSICDLDLFCPDWRLLLPVARDDIAPFIVASFDIETNSSTGKFPDPNIEADACFQIAVSLKRLGETELFDRTCLCYKKTSGPDVVSFDTERELLLAFKKYLVKHDVDIMTGWNIFGFDLEFLYIRAAMNGCLNEFSELGKLRDVPSELVHKKLSSSALGDNVLKILPMPGRFIFDLFHDVKREQKLDSYSLNFVSQHFLGDQKLDMSPKEMFRRFARGDPDELGEVAEYCIKDTVLPHLLMDKLCNLLNLLEMAKATWVPINYLSERGQQIKVFSQMTRKARELGYKVPTIRWGANKGAEEGYTGATVLEAQTGAYYTPITALDFEGLYPSIMIAHNLCYSTLVLDPKYENVPGVHYEQFGPHRFAQDVPSLLPAVLKELKEFRKKAKKDMAGATGAMKQVYNGKQLAYKVSMNSVYGFTGAGKGMLPCVAIASTVTLRGRGMIDETKRYVEENFPGAKVRYGDSVTGDTALLLRVGGHITVKRIDELVGAPWALSGEKETSEIGPEVETWTERGWTRVHRVIRHETDKKIFRVSTRTGCVCVTEDHSLLDPSGVMVKTTQVQPGNKLLHSFPSISSAHLGTFEDSSNQAQSLKSYVALRMLGYDVEVQWVDGVYKVVPGHIENPTEIQSIEEISYTGPVYDLTTENHHFHAGVGQIIVHNTDSVMVEFDVQGRTGQEAIEYSWMLGEQAAEQCTALFKRPNNLELEKVYCPYFLYSKKRYAAKLWTKNKQGQMHMDYIDVKGLQLVRRDNTPFVREVCKELLDVILESKNPEGAKLVAQARAAELLDGRVPMNKLVLSQRLGDTYKSENLPHVQVVRKMRDREPGSEPQVGDRVPFVIVVGGGDKQFEKSEDPKWVETHKVPLDYRYYFTNKFMNPVCDLLEPLVPDPKETLFGGLIEKKTRRGKLGPAGPDQPSVLDMFKKFDKRVAPKKTNGRNTESN